MNRLRTRLLLSLPAALLLGLTACSSGTESMTADDSGGQSAVDMGAPELGVPGAAGGGVSREEAADAVTFTSDGEKAEAEQTGQKPAIISVGTVSVRADDVGDARFEVQKVVDRAGGSITDSETRTDEEGQVRDARLVLRVPSTEFTETIDALEKIGDLEASSTTSEDVTTQMVDTAVRIRIQRESIARIEELLARAATIGDVVSVERELTQREAELNSLLRQRAYLADQTSLSTITVHLQRHPEDGGPEKEGEDGFLAGFEAGWDALGAAAVALATVAGALLPFAAVALLLGLPVLLVVRALGRRRRTPVAYEPEAEPGS